VIFQDVVPFAATHKARRSRSGAKVEIGCNDFLGAHLQRRLSTARQQMGLEIAPF
jgi:hypothetical protein